MKNQVSEKLELDFLQGGGEMGELIRSYDWSTTPLGVPQNWPQSLKTSIAIMLRSGYPIFVWWGQEMIMFHNDAYLPVLGKKHPYALGKPAITIWSEIWDQIGPMMDQVLNKGEQIYAKDLLFLLGRKGFSEECYFTFSYSPIPNDYGGVGGIFCASNEETPKVLRQRRLKTLKDISDLAAPLRSVEEVYDISIQTIAENTHDIPFSLLYILNDSMTEATLEGHTGFKEGKPEAIESVIHISDKGGMWPLQEVIATGKSASKSLESSTIEFPGGPWKESPQAATVVPIQRAGNDRLAGFLICGISPKLEFDYEYQSYIDLVAGQISTAIANVRAFEEERKRAEALAEIDKAKTVFFSNISHEFRTPLTLMLGPLEEVLNQGNIGASEKNQLTIVHRNGLRLLKLVNTLLDFSRIEAGRIQARFQPVQLCEITTELSSVFRSAIEKAGLRFTVDCQLLSQPVYIDPVMWERIIFNLLSNAYKFTLNGEISVRIIERDNRAQLIIKDTGTGIPEAELPKLFTRFHRIEGSKGRTHEGSGIGLAMVHELVKLHGGEIKVESAEGEGTTFFISLPFGKEHLAAETVSTNRNASLVSLNTMPHIEEEFGSYESTVSGDITPEGNTKEYRLLVVDDNADMRNYLCSMLDKYYSVVTCADGQSAYETVLSSPFDLILTDIMMPVLDGIGLLNKLRANERTRSLPVIFLSARAGDEAKVEGIEAGADDYLVKPFGSRELLARVKTNLEMAKVRKEALIRETLLTEELKYSQKRIQSSYETLYNLIMQVPAMVCILKGPEHVYELVNPAYQRLFGSRKLQGLKIREALPELEGQGIFELLDDVYTTGKSHLATEIGAKFIHEDDPSLRQHYFNLLYHPMLDTNDRVEGIFVFAYEVTEEVLARKAAQNIAEELEKKVKARTTELVQKNEELKSQKEFIEIILDSSIDLIGVYDTERRLVAMNKRCEQVLGLKREEILGKKMEDIFNVSGESAPYKDLMRALNGEMVHNPMYKSINIDRYFENYLIPLRNQNEITGVLVIAHDINESIETAEKLKKYNDELLRKNDELEQFAYVSSHDLQEPLRKIQTFSELTAKYLTDQPLAEKYLSKINISAARMSALIRDVLHYSRLSKTNDQFVLTDLNEILENVKTDFESLLSGKNVGEI